VCVRVQGGTGSGRTETACSSDEVSVVPLHTSCANQICLHDKQTAQWPKHSTCNIHSEPLVFIISMSDYRTTRIAHWRGRCAPFPCLRWLRPSILRIWQAKLPILYCVSYYLHFLLKACHRDFTH